MLMVRLSSSTSLPSFLLELDADSRSRSGTFRATRSTSSSPSRTGLRWGSTRSASETLGSLPLLPPVRCPVQRHDALASRARRDGPFSFEVQTLVWPPLFVYSAVRPLVAFPLSLILILILSHSHPVSFPSWRRSIPSRRGAVRRSSTRAALLLDGRRRLQLYARGGPEPELARRDAPLFLLHVLSCPLRAEQVCESESSSSGPSERERCDRPPAPLRPR